MLINRNNYEEFFMLYVDGELSAGDKIAVEKFAAANPDLQEELNLLKETVLVADHEIVFEHKEELYKEEEKKIIGFIWWRIAAAVLLLFGVGTWGWKNLNKEETHQLQVATITPGLHTEVPLPAADVKAADVRKESSIAVTPPAPAITDASGSRRLMTKADKPLTPKVVEKTITETKQETKLDLPTDLTTATIEPPKENIAINVVPQKLNEEKGNEELNRTDNKPLAYEYVDPSDDDIIYVANTSVSKRNKFRGVIRKASRILDRVTSTQ